VADEKIKMTEKDMEEEVSHWPPVSIYLNFFNDNNTTKDYNYIYARQHESLGGCIVNSIFNCYWKSFGRRRYKPYCCIIG
jgi:hypothetical protein